MDLRSHSSTSLRAQGCSGAGRSSGQALCSQSSVLVGNTKRGDKMTSVAESLMKSKPGRRKAAGRRRPGAAPALGVGGGRRSPASPARWGARSEASSSEDDSRAPSAGLNPGAATQGPARSFLFGPVENYISRHASATRGDRACDESGRRENTRHFRCASGPTFCSRERRPGTASGFRFCATEVMGAWRAAAPSAVPGSCCAASCVCRRPGPSGR